MSSKRKAALIAIAVGLLLCLGTIRWISTTRPRALRAATYSQFLGQVHSGRVAGVVIVGSNSGVVEATYRLKDGKPCELFCPQIIRMLFAPCRTIFVNIEIRGPSADQFTYF